MSKNLRIHFPLGFLFLIAFTSGFPGLSAAEDVRISGIVTDNLSTPVSSARVLFIAGGDTSKALTDINGAYTVTLENPSTVDEDFLPAAFRLHQNYPNPFNPSTIIEYDLSIPSSIRLDIYNAAGQLVRHLVSENFASGRHRAVWNGSDERGRHVSAGVYLYRLETGGKSLARKMLLLDGGGSGSIFGKASGLPAYKINTDGTIPVTVVVLKEGYETFREEAQTIPLTSGEIRKDMVMRKILPDGITNDDMKELMRQTFVMAVIDRRISDTSLFKYEFFTLSRKNFDPLWLPSIPEIPLIFHSPAEIQAIADSTQDFLYFKLPKLVEYQDTDIVIIALDFVWAVGKNSRNEYVSGGGIIVKFTRKDSKWEGIITRTWIS